MLATVNEYAWALSDFLGLELHIAVIIAVVFICFPDLGTIFWLDLDVGESDRKERRKTIYWMQARYCVLSGVIVVFLISYPVQVAPILIALSSTVSTLIFVELYLIRRRRARGDP